jgi:2-amino-4-hydroxy-6-hydroxymethyldihydropteridine diphosphokinase
VSGPAARARVLVGLGGNLGGEAAVRGRLAQAAQRLAVGAAQARVSSLYRSAPVGSVGDQPSFLNAVVSLEPARPRSPAAWLDDLVALEDELGRVRDSARPPGGPRAIDLDLLAVGDARESSPRLRLPHPRAAERAFVLRPLVELLGPEVRLPGWTRSAGELLASPPACAQPIERLLGPSWAGLPAPRSPGAERA